MNYENYEFLRSLPDDQDSEKEYERRRYSWGKLDSGLKVNGNRLFSIPTLLIQKLTEEVYKNSAKIIKNNELRQYTVPDQAWKFSMFGSIEASYKLNGLTPTLKELSKAYNSLESKRSKPYKGIVKEYVHCIDDAFDGAKPYDDDISDFKIVDIKRAIFGQDYDQSIDRNTADWISLYNNYNESIYTELPNLPKAFMLYYHNLATQPAETRDSRFANFVITDILMKELDIWTGLGFVSQVLEDFGQVRLMFMQTNLKENMGDCTIWVETMLELILRAQELLLEDD